MPFTRYRLHLHGTDSIQNMQTTFKLHKHHIGGADNIQAGQTILRISRQHLSGADDIQARQTTKQRSHGRCLLPSSAVLWRHSRYIAPPPTTTSPGDICSLLESIGDQSNWNAPLEHSSWPWGSQVSWACRSPAQIRDACDRCEWHLNTSMAFILYM